MFAATWAYWSLVAPQWRLWALARVTNVSSDRLLALAVKNGILWRAGSLFERTEARLGNYRAQQARATLLGASKRFSTSLSDALEDDWGINAIEELQRHLAAFLSAFATRPRDPAAEQAAVGAFAAQLLVHQRAGVLAYPCR
ncbi:MAG: hypothetical protein R2909_14830 [Gemmatimonadales bacterium]